MAISLRCVGLLLLAVSFVPSAALAADEAGAGKKNVPIPVAAVQHSGPIDFEKDILPAFRTSCLACHNKSKPKAGLVLETPADIRKGGDDGLVIKAGKGAESLLLKSAAHAPDVDAPMPPPNNKVAAPNLTPEQLGLIQLWIDQGAAGEVHAAATPLKWQAMPAVLDPIFAVGVSPDGRFAACGRANRIDVYDLPAGKLSAHLVDPALTASGVDSAHRDMVESLAFSPDGTMLASGSFREVKFWKRTVADEKIALGDKPATCAAASPDGKLIATGSEDGVIRLWNAAAAKPAGELTGHSGPVVSVQFSVDSGKLLSLSKDKSIRVWNVAEHKELCKTEPTAEVRCAAWVSDKSIVEGNADGTVSSYTLPAKADGEMSAGKPMKEGASAVTAVVVIPGDESHVFLSREDGGVYRLSVGSGSFKPLFKHGSSITCLAVRADGKRVVTAGSDNVAKVWNVEDGKLIAELKGDPAIIARTNSADRSLALARDEVGYRKRRLETFQSQVKASAERAQKAKDAVPAAEKALADAQKAFDTAKAAMDAADAAAKDKKEKLAREFALADEALKKAKEVKATTTDNTQKAREAAAKSEQQTASAQRKFDAAKAAAETKGDAEKETAAKEFTAAEDALKTAKEAQASVVEQSQKAKDAGATAEKALASAQKTLDGARSAKESAENAKDDKKESAEKDFAKAEDELKKTKTVRASADDEIKLAGRSVEDSAAALATATSAVDAAGERLKAREKEAADTKNATASAAKPIRGVAFSTSGALIATAGDDGSVHTWSSDKGLPGEVLGNTPAALAAVAFVGADRVLVCPANQPPALLNPSSTWKLIRTLGNTDSTSPFGDRVTSLDFSPDGHLLATGGGVPTRAGEIRLFDVDSGMLKKAFDDVHSDTVFCVRFSPDGSQLASAGADRFVRLLDLASGKVIRGFEGHAGHALAVAWSHDGHTLASGGADNTLRFWDAETGERGKVVTGFDKEVTSVSFVGDALQACAASGDGKVRLVRADGGDVRGYSGPADFQYALSASQDGTTLVAGGQDGTLRAWNAATGTVVGTFPAVEKK